MNAHNSLPPRALVQENEISGLIEWSIPWVKGFAAVCFLVGLQGVGLAIVEVSGMPRETLVWELFRASTQLTLGYCLLDLAKSGTRFVALSEERRLGEVMAGLCVVWAVLTLAFLATVISAMAAMGDAFFLKHTFSLTGPGLLLTLVTTALGPGVAYLMWSYEKKKNFASDFIRHINPFATHTLPWLRFLSVFAVAGGALITGFGVADYLYDVTGGATRVIGSGTVLAAFGAALQWYRRAVRDIQRNPTPYFFERTLNRLNLFWLLATVFSLALFVIGFF